MAPNPLTGCPVDHASISTSYGSQGWTRCPFCDIMIEGAMRTGVVTGPAWGPGRGDLTPRQRARLRSWAGWSDWNGPR